MDHDLYLGCDPGKSGAIAVLTADGSVAACIRLNDTEHDIADSLRAIVAETRACAMLERVSAMPKQGVSSTFKFGQSYGFLRGLLVALRVPFCDVTPVTWQGHLKCRTKGDKNVSKAAAQQRWPTEKIIHANADALLIAEYCRQKYGRP